MNDNELLLDWLVTQQMRWILFGNDCAAQVIAALNPDLRSAIAAPNRTQIRAAVAVAYSGLQAQAVARTCYLDAACEAGRTWAKHLGTNERMACERARQEAAAGIILGATLASLIASVIADDQRRIARTIIFHRMQGATTDQIADQVALVKKVGERSMHAAIRSAIAAATQAGGEVVWRGMTEFDALMWLSVLDSVTSEICRYRHGRIAPLPGLTLPARYASHPKLDPPGARPPAHPNCRSAIIALLAAAGLPVIPSYYQWLRRQPADVQSDALGPTRYNIWKRRGVAPERFSDEGRRLTLAELRARL